MLPPDVLIDRYFKIGQTAQRFMRQLPDEKLLESAVHNRDRPVRKMCHHIFCIGEAHLRCAIDGASYGNNHTSKVLEDGTFMKSEEIAQYGDEIMGRMREWWQALEDKTCAESRVTTDYGTISLHQLLERTTWHSAQHTRQLAAVLERFEIKPDGELRKEYLQGLPLPERLWE